MAETADELAAKHLALSAAEEDKSRLRHQLRFTAAELAAAEDAAEQAAEGAAEEVRRISVEAAQAIVAAEERAAAEAAAQPQPQQREREQQQQQQKLLERQAAELLHCRDEAEARA